MPVPLFGVSEKKKKLKSCNSKSNCLMRKVKKENLPTKICPVCNRPFSWRKKWEKVWDEVKYCSDKCRTTKIVNGNNTISKST